MRNWKTKAQMGDKTKMGLKETKWEAVNWIHFTKNKD